jgi:hypothetical protein
MDPEDLFASTLHVVAAGGGKWIPVADGACSTISLAGVLMDA